MVEVFNSITKEIKEHQKVIIMAHKNIDYDALGSALGFYEIINSFGKNAAIYMEKKLEDTLNPKLYDLIDNLNINFVYKNTYKNFIDEKTLLIIVDTHKETMLANKEILKQVKTSIVIDHHIKGTDYLKDVYFSYIDSNLSSINEFVAFYLKYLNKKVNPLIATIMLTGIELDTGDFHTKTTPNTFAAASFLSELGANTFETLELMKEDKEQSIKRMRYLSNSYTINDCIMICPLDDEILAPKDLAIISDMQMRFSNINLGFVIGKLSDDTVGISARSNGKYNVEKIMKIMGGGGHANEAAAQIKDKTIKEVEHKLTKIIKEVK